MKNILKKIMAIILVVSAVVTIMPATSFAATKKEETIIDGVTLAYDELFLKDWPVGSYLTVSKKACGASCKQGHEGCDNCQIVNYMKKYYGITLKSDRRANSCVGGARAIQIITFGVQYGAYCEDKDKKYGQKLLVKNADMTNKNTFKNAHAGDLVIFRDGSALHEGVIYKIEEDGITFLHTNWGSCNKVYTTKILFGKTLSHYKYVTIYEPRNLDEIRVKYCQHQFNDGKCIGCGYAPKPVVETYDQPKFVDITKNNTVITDLVKSCNVTTLKNGDCVSVIEKRTQLVNNKIDTYYKLSDGAGYILASSVKDHTCKDKKCNLCLSNASITVYKNAKNFKIIKKDAAIHYSPGSESKLSVKLPYVSKNVTVKAVKKAVNSLGNVWYCLESGLWIYGDYVKEVK